MVMYHAHCQRIYDAISRANFNEVCMCVCSVCVRVHVRACECVVLTKLLTHITGGEFSAAFLAGYARAHADDTGPPTHQ